MIEEPTLLEQDELDRAAAARARELRTIIQLGIDIERFLAGPLGQRIMRDAESERLALMEELVECDPDDAAGLKRAREIRRRIDILDHWQNAFAGYLNEAKDAQHQYIEGEVTGDEPEQQT